METATTSNNSSNKSWLSKVCNKLRTGGKQRPEKCEKCGQRSDTCRPNPSFISGRKHYLCGDCRVSARNMKTMYHQLCRNLSLREASRTNTYASSELSSFSSSSNKSSSPSDSPSSCRASQPGGGLTRSLSLKVRPTSPAESGYETATSLDSSSSSSDHHHHHHHHHDDCLSEEDPALCASCGGGGECGVSSAAAAAASGTHEESAAKDVSPIVCHSRTEVFGGAFKSERVHLQRLQQFMTTQEWVDSQRRQAPQPQPELPTTTPTATPITAKPVRPAHPAKNTPTTNTAATKQYDGYLEIRTPNSRSVKYVFKKPEGEESGLDNGHHHLHQQQQQQKADSGLKQCYRCHRQHSVAFRAPFGNGWLCEDCMDDLM